MNRKSGILQVQHRIFPPANIGGGKERVVVVLGLPEAMTGPTSHFNRESLRKYGIKVDQNHVPVVFNCNLLRQERPQDYRGERLLYLGARPLEGGRPRAFFYVLKNDPARDACVHYNLEELNERWQVSNGELTRVLERGRRDLRGFQRQLN